MAFTTARARASLHRRPPRAGPVLQAFPAATREPPSPPPHRVLRAADGAGDGRVPSPRGGEEDDPRAGHVPLRRGGLPCDPFQRSSLLRGEDYRCLRWCGRGSSHPAAMGTAGKRSVRPLKN